MSSNEGGKSISDFNSHSLSEDNAHRVLRYKGAEFWIDNGVLRYRAPKGRVTPEDISALCQVDRRVLCSLFRQAEERPEPRLLKRMDPMHAPLGFSQLGHWNLQQTTTHRPTREVATAIRLRGSLDSGALKEALSVVVSRHEALRTRIVVSEGVPVQEIATRTSCDLQIFDLTSIPPLEQPSEVHRQIVRAIVDVSDYAVDALCTGTLLILSPAERVLILAMDHIVADGASLALVFSELITVYVQLARKSQVVLPAVRMQLADYAFWQRTELAGWLARRFPEWIARRRIRFPDQPSTEDLKGWGVVRFTIDARAKCVLQDWARHQKTSIVMTVLSAYVAMVLRYCETGEAMIQFISDGRLSPLLEHTVGDITFPLNLHVLGDERVTFLELLERVTHQYCLACEEPEFAYGFVQDPIPEWVRNTQFNWIPERRDYKDCSSAEPTVLTYSHMKFDHPVLEVHDWDGEPSVTFWEAGSEIIGEVGFPRKRFSYPSMRRFAGMFQSLLHSLLAAPTKCIRDIPSTGT